MTRRLGEIQQEGIELGTVSVAVIGGEDSDIADVLRHYIAPGVNTYGNARVTTNVSGFCRSMSIIRPIEVPVQVDIKVVPVQDERHSIESVDASEKPPLAFEPDVRPGENV